MQSDWKKDFETYKISNQSIQFQEKNEEINPQGILERYSKELQKHRTK